MEIAIRQGTMGADSYGILCHTATRVFGKRGIGFTEGAADYEILLHVNAEYKKDRYTVCGTAKNATLTAGCDRDLHAAFGRLLLESFMDGNGGFRPFVGKIDFTPERPVRGMYFATHCGNFYHRAPLEKVYEIVEDLALRGCNVLIVWFDMFPYHSMEDEAAVALADRLHAILRYANRIGIGGGFTMNANEAFHDSPPALRADWWKQGRYKADPRAHYHRELCPSRAGGIEEIIKERREELSRFTDLDISYIFYWPYDQGGCTCPDCEPWGANGFVKLYPHFRALIRELFPRTDVIVSTWYFDRFIDGEWDAFYPKMSDGTFRDVPYFLSFFHEGKLPECIEKQGIPEGVAFVDFAEISMQFCRPWGGFGANPLSRFLQRTLDGSGHLYSGGFPYSEGIFEDINKFIMLTWYAGLYPQTADAVRAYVKFEFGLEGDACEELADAIIRTETALPREHCRPGRDPGYTEHGYPMADVSEVDAVRDVLEKYNGIVAKGLREDWKFRFMYLRALYDAEMPRCDFLPATSARCRELSKEINAINCVKSGESGEWLVSPADA